MSQRRGLITGCSRGIGAAISRELAESDIEVVVTSRTSESAAQTQFECHAVDFSDAQAVEVFAAAVTKMSIDILVNNAGIAGPTGPVEAIDPDDFERTLAINITGQFLCTRLAVPHLKAAGGGAIINLSSAAGKFAFPLRSPYSASKWAVVGFTKSLAAELGSANIRVNAILPGAVEGPRIERVIAAKAVCFEEALQPGFAAYQEQIVRNAAALADAPIAGCYEIENEQHAVIAQVPYYIAPDIDSEAA